MYRLQVFVMYGQNEMSDKIQFYRIKVQFKRTSFQWSHNQLVNTGSITEVSLTFTSTYLI